MQKLILAVVLLCLAVPMAESANSADCICRIMAMYPVDATNWFHYATVNATGTPSCSALYPTGYVGPPQYGQSCYGSPGTCGTCGTLQAAAAVAGFELYYGDPASGPQSYDALDGDDKVKGFLKTNIPPGADPTPYDDFIFSRPFPNSYQKPIALLLTRKVGNMTEEFHAIVWRVKQKNTPHSDSYVGIEITGELPRQVKVVKPVSFCNAVSTRKDETTGAIIQEPIPGLLQANFAKGQSPKDDSIAFIRLHNSDKNRNAGYEACKK